MTQINRSIDQWHALGVDILVAHRTSEDNARCVMDALMAAEVDGQIGHGLSRLPSYAAQAASGKVDGHARPRLQQVASAVLRVDAANGFAFPAARLAVEALAERAAETGIALAAIHRSHHFGQAGYHVEKLADRGLVGLAFANSPQAIAPWGGNQGLFGTNPIAFAAPRRDNAPLLIDLSLGKVARGKIMVAARQGLAIPEGWALDREGHPTTDPEAALGGTLLPMGDAKGAALVMMVEILAAGLTGAHFGFEASSFFSGEGEPPAVGQLLIAIDPAPCAGGAFAERLETLIAAVLAQPGTRAPGGRRLAARKQAARHGVDVDQSLERELAALHNTVS